MTENLGKITALTLAVLLAAVASMVAPVLFGESPFRLGLDLQGGTRLVYQLPFEKAVETGQITQAELADKPALLQNTATIMRGRIDPQGVLEMSIRPEGTDRIVIELPGAAELATTETVGKLKGALDGTATSLELDAGDVALIKLFPQSGGLVRIGDERLLYATRSGAVLAGLKRGAEKTTAAPHDAGAAVELLSSDDLQKRIENVGDMQFLLQASAADFSRGGSDESSELSRMQTWRTANPSAPVEDYNRLARDAGGPIDGLRWHPMRLGRDELDSNLAQRAMIPLVVPRPAAGEAGAWNFTGSDLDSVTMSQDEYGYPAVAFEIAPEKKVAFGDFTQASIGRGMAIVLNGEIATLATIRSKLPGGGQISGGAGGFTPKEVQDLITVLRSGSLKIKPILLDKARVGASLGEDYVGKGLYSALFATLVVVAFMVFTYKRLGFFAVAGLLVNLVLLMGSLAFLRATLTLPGIAGIVLTVGMAVDGNILIFERLREELARGLKLKEAARAGFERAAVTILDSNLTTLIAGAILYWAGTGPIRGFATTLCIGILTTLFTVIVVSKLLVFRDLSAGRTGYEMRELVKGQGIDFLGKTKAALGLSALVIVGTVGLFVAQDNEQKLGIDFLGGFSVSARTQEPQSVETIRSALQQAGGVVAGATVQAITDSSQGAGYTEFRITAKLGEGGEREESAKSAETEIRRALAAMLQRGPVELSLKDGAVAGEIYFEAPHSVEDVAASMAKDGLGNVALVALPAPANSYKFTATAGASATQAELSTALTRRFTATLDSKGVPYALMSPIPESSVVGPQVGGELRDKAIRALILAMFATILYLRFRFDQWSYGIAVVAALVHDVLVTLGALAVANQFGFVQSEVDLSMIAAFLTIIGYSQNDTIVIFDRVRENIAKSKKPLRQILNDSVNETLGRTILTSVTVFLTIVVLFVANYGSRNVLEGFAFAMIVGVVSGTYSTIYIASPVLLWLEKRAGRASDDGSVEAAAKA